MGFESSYSRFPDAYLTCGASVDYMAHLCPRCTDNDVATVVASIISDTNYPRRARAALRLHAMTETLHTMTFANLERAYRWSDSAIAKAFEQMSMDYSWSPSDQIGHAESCEQCHDVIGYDWCACVACNREGDIGADSVYLETINDGCDRHQSVAVLCNDCISGGDAADTYQTLLGDEYGATIARYAAWIESTFSYYQGAPREYDARVHGIGRFLGDERRSAIASAHVGELFPS